MRTKHQLKKINSLSWLFLLSFQVVWAQQPSDVREDSTLVYSGSYTSIDTTKLIFTSWKEDGTPNDYVLYHKIHGKWFYSSKQMTTWDESSRTSSLVFEGWNSSHASWIPQTKRDQVVDKKGRITNETNWSYDTVKAEFVPTTQFYLTLDDSGNVLTENDFTWDITLHAWQGVKACQYQYQGRNVIHTLCYIDFDSTQQAITAKVKTEEETDLLHHDLQVASIWDSLHKGWIDTAKYEKDYDSLTHVTTQIRYTWDSAQHLLRYDTKNEDESFNDTKQEQYVSASYAWDTTSHTWIGLSKDWYNTSYLSQIRSSGKSAWDTVHQTWYDTERNVVTWDPSGKYVKLEEVYETVPPFTTAKLYKRVQHHLQFDNSGNLLVDSSMEDNNWGNDLKTVYAYTASRRIASTTLFRLSFTLQDTTWLPFQKTTQTFDGKDSISGSILYFWSESESAWIASQKADIIYDNQGRYVSNTQYSWNTQTHQWKKSGELEQIFSPSGPLLQSTYAIGNDSTDVLFTTNEFKQTVDEQGRDTYLATFIFNASTKKLFPATETFLRYDSYGNNVYKRAYAYDVNADRQFLNQGFDVFYSTHLTTELVNQEISPNSWELYPNPASDHLYFKNIIPSHFQILDLAGHELKKGTFSSSLPSIEVIDLPAGSYLLKLEADGTFATKVFIHK